jgi:hypothetical protein
LAKDNAMDFGNLQAYFTHGYGFLLVGSIALLIIAIAIKATRKGPVEISDGPDLRWWRADRRFETQYDV